MVEFGEQLKKAREEKGLSQQALAEQLYVTRQSISRWERGDRSPDLVTTKRIAQILELSIDSLLSDEDMPEVVEKSPVIESRMGNNVSIALYMSIVLLRFIEQVQYLMEWYGIQAAKRFDYGTVNLVSVFSYTIEASYGFNLYCKRFFCKDITVWFNYLSDSYIIQKTQNSYGLARKRQKLRCFITENKKHS